MDGTTDSWLPFAAMLASSAMFLAIWFGSLHLLARGSGWRRLADAYPPSGVLGSGLGETFRLRSITMRSAIHYNLCVSLSVSPSALRISMPWIVSAGPPPIEIPWSEIRSEAGRVWWNPVVTLRFARAPSVPVSVRRRLADGLARASGGQLAPPPGDGVR